MRWLADECIAASLVDFLRQAGHDVHYVAERASGSNDVEVVELAAREERLLLTEDKDFDLPARAGGARYRVDAYCVRESAIDREAADHRDRSVRGAAVRAISCH